MNGSCLVRNRAFMFVTCCHIFSAMVCSTWCSPDVVGRRNQAQNTTRSTRRTCSGRHCRVKPSGDRHTHARALQDNCSRDFRRPCPPQACSSSIFFQKKSRWNQIPRDQRWGLHCALHAHDLLEGSSQTASMSWPERLCESPSGSVQPESFAEERASAFNLRKGGSWTSGKSACLCDLCVGHVSC